MKQQWEASHANSTSEVGRSGGGEHGGARVFETGGSGGRGSSSGGLRESAGRAGTENAVGRTRPTGNLDRRIRHALAAPRQVCKPRIFHRGAASRIGQRASVAARPGQ